MKNSGKKQLLSFNKRILLFLIAIIGIQTSTNAQERIQNVYAREHISLNGNWNYIIDPYQNGYYNYRLKPFDELPSSNGGFFENRTEPITTNLREYNFDKSSIMTIPGDWNSQVENLALYEGTIWFKKDFNVTFQRGKRYFIDFGAVNYESHVYVNGKKVGNHKGGFTPFQFDVTEHLNDGNNFVVVMVDNTRKKDEIPTINTDWWNYGGITRDVLLVSVPENHIKDYQISLSPSDKNIIQGSIEISDSNTSEKVTLEIPELKIKENLSVKNGIAEFEIRNNNIKCWSPDSPKLYTLTLSTSTDKVTDEIGFRQISTEGKKILLNGKQIFLKGISIHDENPMVEGRLRSEADMQMLLNWAKELGCNYVRLAHYTHDEKMVKLAEKMGLLVWSEIPVYWTISWKNEDTYKNAEAQLVSSISRDKNRANIIIWSVGNETPISDERNKFMRRLISKVKEMDKTRLVSAALEIEREGYTIKVDDKLGEVLDVVSFNEYGGWYWGKVEDLPKYQFEVNFNKPVCISEFGGGALGGYHGDEKTLFTEENQELLYKKQLEMLNNLDGLSGMTPWILVDFKSPRRQHPILQNFWNRKGLISPDGQKKKAFYVLKNYYENKKY